MRIIFIKARKNGGNNEHIEKTGTDFGAFGGERFFERGALVGIDLYFAFQHSTGLGAFAKSFFGQTDARGRVRGA